MTYMQDYETGASQLDTFLYNATGDPMDSGTRALASVHEQLWANQPQGTSLDFIEQEGSDLRNGLVEVYGQQYDQQRLQNIGRVLAGAYVITALTPEIALPSAVAVQQQNSSELQLWVWRQPWRASGITEDQTKLLAAAAQLEAPGAGSHQAGKKSTAEAQHLLSVLSIAEKPAALASWSNGGHINHSPQFRRQGTLPAVSGNLLSQEYQVSSLRMRRNPQGVTEIAIDNNAFQAAPHTRLLWHRDSMQSANEQGIAVCDSPDALTIVQGAGFMAMRHAISNVQRVIDGERA